MGLNNKKNHLSRIIIFFIMLLFAMCFTMNAFLGSNYNIDELSGKSIAIEKWSISESIAADGDGDHTAYVKSFVLNKHNSYAETRTRDICPISLIAAISKGFCLFLFFIIIFFLSLFILLPDGWTLINQKVRLDN